MPRFSSAVLLSLLASVALAAPKHARFHHKHHHGTGTGTAYSTGYATGAPYPIHNSTGWYAPTGTGAPVVYSTVIVSPLPATGLPTDSPVNATVSSPVKKECGGPPTTTLTASNTVTVTVPNGSDGAGASTSAAVSAPYGLGNGTSYGPTGTWTSWGTAAASSSAAAVPVPYSSPSIAPAHKVTWTAPLVNPSASSSSIVAALPVSSSTTSSSSSAAAVVAPPSSTSTSTTSLAPVYTPAVPSASKPTSTTVVAAAAVVPSSYSSSAAAVTAIVAVPATPASGVKRGVVYNTASLCAPFASSTAVGWGYNWGASSGGLASSLNFVPTLWGLNGQQTNFVKDAAAALIASAEGEKFICGFNEPDEASQYGGSQLSVSAAVTGWNTYIQPFASQGVQLGSPAVTNANSTSPLMGAPWLQSFMSQCDGCTFDFVVAHWYGWSGGTAQQQATAFQNYVTAFHATFNKPVWVTEFSALPLEDQATNSAFIAIVLPWLDSQPASVVSRYSYFMVTDGSLVNGASLTQMGTAYLSG